jgi:hypothetical protein
MIIPSDVYSESGGVEFTGRLLTGDAIENVKEGTQDDGGQSFYREDQYGLDRFRPNGFGEGVYGRGYEGAGWRLGAVELPNWIRRKWLVARGIGGKSGCGGQEGSGVCAFGE